MPIEHTLITLPGIFEESSPDGTVRGMWTNFTEHLPVNWTCRQHDWHNNYGPFPPTDIGAQSYMINVTAAAGDVIRMIDELVADDPDASIVLAGYSGGAQVATIAAAALLRKIDALLLVANPIRAQGDSAAPGGGIAGTHPPFVGAGVFTTLDLANPKDMIPCCTPESPLRSFYTLTRFFSLADPVLWGREVLKAVADGTAYRSALDSTPQEWLEAVEGVYGYCFGGQHTTAYEALLPDFARQASTTLG